MKQLNIIVTAGGITERIDSVRKITNSSSGKLGIKIANALSRQYPTAKITIIGSKQAFRENVLEPHCFIKNGEMKCVTIESTADLEREVTLRLTKEHVDIFVHTMAVADYTTESVIDFDKFTKLIEDGHKDVNTAMKQSVVDTSSKMSSSLNMMIKMKQTPKIIHLIKTLSPRTFLVGFKLLNDVTEEHLFDVGFDLLRKNRCNLVVANDLANIRKGNHKALIIYPEKSYDVIEGKDEIADQLTRLIDKRAFVKHPHSICISEDNSVSGTDNEINRAFQQIKKTGERLYLSGYLPIVKNHERTDESGTYGNISIKLSNGDILITSRNVHKGKLKPKDVSRIQMVDEETTDENVYANIYYRSKEKPSIDTAIHAELYKRTHGNAIIHVHTNRVFLGYPYVDDQFPCGSMEERNAIVHALIKGYSGTNEINPTYVVQMKKHGLIIIGPDIDTCEHKLKELFHETPYIHTKTTCTDKEVLSHIEEVHANFINTKGSRLYNLELASEVIGCIWELHEDNNVNFGIFTKSDCPKGLHIVENYLKLYDKKYYLFTTHGCQIANFYKTKYQFKDIYQTNDGTMILSR